MPAARAVRCVAVFVIASRSKVCASRTLPRHRYCNRTYSSNDESDRRRSRSLCRSHTRTVRSSKYAAPRQDPRYYGQCVVACSQPPGAEQSVVVADCFQRIRVVTLPAYRLPFQPGDVTRKQPRLSFCREIATRKTNWLTGSYERLPFCDRGDALVSVKKRLEDATRIRIGWKPEMIFECPARDRTLGAVCPAAQSECDLFSI
jgi:hypothetical protein